MSSKRRVVADFNANPTLKELIGHRTVRGSEQGYIARPFVVKTDCLGCHGDPKDSSSPAPDRVAIRARQVGRKGKPSRQPSFTFPSTIYGSIRSGVLGDLEHSCRGGRRAAGISYVLFVKFLKRAAQLVATNRSLESEIADRVRAEASLRTSETKYKTLYDSSRDAILLSTPETGFVGGNPAAIRLFACKDESDLIACTPADVSPERQPDGELSATKAQRMMAIALREGSHCFEWMHKRQDGTEFLTSISMTRMELEGQCLLLGTVRDITDRKRAEAEQTLTTQRMESLLALNHMTDRPMEEIVAAVVEEAIRLTAAKSATWPT